MYSKLSRQVDQDLGVLKAAISELKQQSLLQKWSTELERISLASQEIKGLWMALMRHCCFYAN